jgi:hypothetical protein
LIATLKALRHPKSGHTDAPSEIKALFCYLSVLDLEFD